MMEETKRFVNDEDRQKRLRKKCDEKYGSVENARLGLLVDYDDEVELADEVREKKPVMVMAVCEAGMNRSKLVAEALEDKGMGYVASYAGVNEGMAYPLSEQKLQEDQPQAIIFSTRGEKERFGERFPGYCEEKVETGEVILRVIGLSESGVARRLNKDDRTQETEEARRLREAVKERLIKMGFESLGDSWK